MSAAAVNMIAAIGRRGQIGLHGSLPWFAPPDQAMFREATWGSVVVMGARTFDELAMAAGTAQPLPGRIVYDFRRHNTPDGMLRLIALERPGWPVWIAGGAHTYRAFAPFVTGLKILSAVDYDGPADTWFPFDAYGMAMPEGASDES